MAIAESLLPGTFNARDLGGLRADRGVVRKGVLFRSDAPLGLGPEGREQLRRLGIRTAIDLREEVERELQPPDLAGLELEVVQEPILGEEFEVVTELTLDQLYMSLIETRGERFAAAIKPLAAAQAVPALVFCSAGKDRTGLVSAIVLSAVGVDDDEIVADYQRTEGNIRGRFRKQLEQRARDAGVSQQELAVKLGAPAALMWRVLAVLRDQHGGAAPYLRAHGLEHSELESLRNGLIAPV